MTTDRKNELFDKMLAWIYEHIREEEDLFIALHDHLGFTKEEANNCSIDSLDHLYEKLPVIQRFNEKIATRFDEYKDYWSTLSPKELIEKCDEIYTVTRLATKLPHQITEAQAEYFLLFVDPLEAISGSIIRDHQANPSTQDEEIKNTLTYLTDTCAAEGYCEMEDEAYPEIKQSM